MSSLRDSKVDQLTTKDQDMRGRRSVNAAASVDKADYVIKQELEDATSYSTLLIWLGKVLRQEPFNFLKIVTFFNVVTFIGVVTLQKVVTFLAGIVLNKLTPLADGLQAIQLTKADGTTVFGYYDSTNGFIVISGSYRALSRPVAAPATGTGVELLYASGIDRGIVGAFDRTGGVAKDMMVQGDGLYLNHVTLGFFNAAPAAKQTLAAYTSNSQGSAYTGLATGLGGTPYASLTDLNALRVAYQNLLASYNDLQTKIRTTTLVG